MTYRRDRQKALNWRKWLLKNQAILDRCGLPERILKDEAHWWDFLDHGFLDHHGDISQFKLEDLSAKQLNELFTFLNAELSAEDKISCLVLRVLPSLLEKHH
jgi:hypothetical protein